MSEFVCSKSIFAVVFERIMSYMKKSGLNRIERERAREQRLI